jgi:YegS/Rv2252/BmrU family lipid kinase
MHTRTVALIANTESGSGEAGEVAERLRALGAAVKSFGVDEAAAAARAGTDRIVVSGGAGSIGGAAAAAAVADCPLAVIPTGTANDFARALDLPVDLDEACLLAMEGTETARLDLGRVDGRPFVNVVSAGISPAAASEAEGFKRALGPLAYTVGALRAGVTAQPLRCTVSGDGEELFSGRAWQVSVACTGAFGGGASLDTDAQNRRLDVVVIPAGSRVALIRRAFGMRLGSLRRQEPVGDHLAQEVTLEVPPKTRFNVDGEVERSGTVELTVEPAAFDLLVG